MKGNTMIIIGVVVLVVVLFGVALFLPGKANKPFKENLYIYPPSVREVIEEDNFNMYQ